VQARQGRGHRAEKVRGIGGMPEAEAVGLKERSPTGSPLVVGGGGCGEGLVELRAESSSVQSEPRRGFALFAWGFSPTHCAVGRAQESSVECPRLKPSG